MTRTVFCRKYGENLPGLERPPFPGPRGEDIFQHVSQKAWDEWRTHQTMLINEKRLNLLNTEDRQFLQTEMEHFLSGEDYTWIEGHVPPPTP